MDRIELMEQLSEAWDTLPEEIRAEVALLSASDPEIKLAMDFSRTLSAVRIANVYPNAKSSDAAFLTSVRNRISGHSTAGYAKLFPSAKGVAIAASACVVMLVAVIVGGRMPSVAPVTDMSSVPMTDQVSEPSSSAKMMALSERAAPMMLSAMSADDADAAPISVDSLANAGVNAMELAAYLNVSDVAEQVIDTLDGDSLPLTDELLALDTGTLEEVLDDLEATSFF